jgi:hypothetical protein
VDGVATFLTPVSGTKWPPLREITTKKNNHNYLNFLIFASVAFWWGNLRERDHWGDPGVDGRIILRWIFK